MQRLTTVSRALPREFLPPNLSLLAAEVVDARTDASVGQVTGVIADDAGRVVSFVVKLTAEGLPAGARILVPTTGVEICDADATGDVPAKLRILWTQEQILAQPRFDHDTELPHDRVTGVVPPEGRFAPDRPNRVPPGSGGNGRMAAILGAQAAVVGGAVGALIGFVFDGLGNALGLGLMFLIGSGIAGALVGASRESAVDAGELGVGEVKTTAGTWQVHRLEEALRGPVPFLEGMVRATPISTNLAHRTN